MRFNRRFAALSVIAVAVAVPVAGCGGGDDDNSTSAETAGATQASTTGGAAGGGQTVDMTVADFKLTASDPTVKSGDVTSKLTTSGQNPHSLEIEDVNGQDQEIEGMSRPARAADDGEPAAREVSEFYCPVDGHK